MRTGGHGKSKYEIINYHVDDTRYAYESSIGLSQRHPAELRNYLN